MGQWWEKQWGLRLHGIILPFGVFIVTTLLTRWISGQWPGQANLKLAAELVDLATVIYGMMALTVEGGVRLMFWALQKHLEWRDSMREEGRIEGRVEGREEGRETGRAEGAKAGRKAERAATEAHLEKVSKETGIPLERLLPPQREE